MPAAKGGPANKRAKSSNASPKVAKAETTKIKPKASSKVPAKRSRIQGRLANLMTMPVDIFAEICFYLSPIDLLHLAWSSKRLRSILMSETVRPIWRSALENQFPTLPACPDDLSEPQYIALLFTNICQGCGGSRAHRIDLFQRTRHCGSCYPKHVGTSVKAVYERYGYGVDVSEIAEAMPRDKVSYKNAYSLKALQRSLAEYRAIDEDLRRVEFLKSLKEKSCKMEKHAVEVSKWLSEQNRIKEQQTHDVTETRWKSIQKRLKELGWEECDFLASYDNEWIKLTRKSQALTDKVWKNLYPKLEPMLEREKATRIEKETALRREARMGSISIFYSLHKVHNFKADVFYPADTCIFTVASVKRLVEDDQTGNVTAALWEACVPELEEALRRGTETVLREVKAYYKMCTTPDNPKQCDSGTNPDPGDVAMSNEDDFPDMSLVTSVLKCSQCQEGLWLSNFYRHHHFVANYKWSPDSSHDCSDPALPYHDTLCYDPKLQEVVSALLTISGMDPLTSTVQDDVIVPGGVYACDRCDDDHQEPVGFGKLVSHYMAETAWFDNFKIVSPKRSSECTNNHSVALGGHTTDPVFRLLGEEESVKMRIKYWRFLASFEEIGHLPGYDYNIYWCSYLSGSKICNHCPSQFEGRYAIGQMVIHMKAKHGIDVDFDNLGALPDEDEDEDPMIDASGHQGLHLEGDNEHDDPGDYDPYSFYGQGEGI